VYLPGSMLEAPVPAERLKKESSVVELVVPAKAEIALYGTVP
jgi:hypothetical protein